MPFGTRPLLFKLKTHGLPVNYPGHGPPIYTAAMATQGSNTGAIAVATGRKWTDWVDLLHQADATNLDHREIAKLAQSLMPASIDNPEWWAQSVAVAFEQDAGLRRPGQRRNGTFQGSVTTTVGTGLDGALERWIEATERLESFNGQQLVGEPRMSSSQRWRYWKAGFSDDTQAQVDIGLRGSKSSIAVNITKAQSAEAVSEWKNFWRQILTQIKD